MPNTNTNASDSGFGWDFQINAAIVIILEDVANVEKVRVEGEKEDIEVTLDNGGIIFSQAKSCVDPTSTSNVHSKLEKALQTLNTAAANPSTQKLIYITNAYNPFNDAMSMMSLYGQARKSYYELPDSAKTIIDEILQKKALANIDKTKLYVYTLPFENAINDRYKVVLEKVKDFISSIKSSLSGIAQEVLDIWQQQLFHNATLHDTSVTINKYQLMWPLVVVMCDRENRLNPFEDEMDDADYTEIMERYHSFISCRSQKFPLVTRVVGDYQNYSMDGIKGNDKILSFIRTQWQRYTDDFTNETPSADLEKLIKITLYRILQQKQFISEIKKKVNLL